MSSELGRQVPTDSTLVFNLEQACEHNKEKVVLSIEDAKRLLIMARDWVDMPKIIQLKGTPTEAELTEFKKAWLAHVNGKLTNDPV